MNIVKNISRLALVAAILSGCRSTPDASVSYAAGAQDPIALFNNGEIAEQFADQETDSVVVPIVSGEPGIKYSGQGFRIMTDVRQGNMIDVDGRRVAGFRYRVSWYSDADAGIVISLQPPTDTILLIRISSSDDILAKSIVESGMEPIDLNKPMIISSSYMFLLEPGGENRSTAGIDGILLPADLESIAVDLAYVEKPDREIKKLIKRNKYAMMPDKESAIAQPFALVRVPEPGRPGKVVLMDNPKVEAKLELYRVDTSEEQLRFESVLFNDGVNNSVNGGDLYLYLSPEYLPVSADDCARFLFVQEPAGRAFLDENVIDLAASHNSIRTIAINEFSRDEFSIHWYELSGIVDPEQIMSGDSIHTSIWYFQLDGKSPNSAETGKMWPPSYIVRTLSGRIERYNNVENPTGADHRVISLIRVAPIVPTYYGSYRLDLHPETGVVERKYDFR